MKAKTKYTTAAVVAAREVQARLNTLNAQAGEAEEVGDPTLYSELVDAMIKVEDDYYDTHGASWRECLRGDQ